MAAMAHHVAFDTLKFVETLIVAGMPAAQAKALSEAQKEVFEEVLDSTLATKVNIQQLKDEIIFFKTEMKSDIGRLDRRVDKIEIELHYMRWMLGILILGVGSLVAKAFL